MSLVRNLLQFVGRRTISTSSSLYKKGRMMDAFQINTGPALKEMQLCRDGCEDPWDMRPRKRLAGTRDCPNMIPSATDHRFVGCVCCEDSTHINWLLLRKGEPQRCECGCWFQLCHKDPVYPHHHH